MLTGCGDDGEAENASPTASLQVGDCLQLVDGSGDATGSVDPVACDEEHSGEVVLAASEFFAEDPELPPDDRLQSLAGTACEDAMTEYAGTSAEQAGVRLSFLYPSLDTWSQGDRALTCVAVSYNELTGEIVSVTGTLAA